MEFRVLQYFLAVAREETISGAADFLHITQPTLSRQMKELEDELGKQLFIRGNRQITLTEDGMLLRKRAEEIVDLVKKTEAEITLSDEIIAGEVHIGAGETDGFRLIARTMNKINEDHPQISCHIFSGNAIDVLEQLDKGLLDFGILIGQVDITKYDYIKFPIYDTWGVYMRHDSELAKKETIKPEDLWDKPLIISRQSVENNELSQWLKIKSSDLNITATYNLINNAALMVDEGLGYALSLDKLINTTGKSNLCFRPLEPKLNVELAMVWKKYQIFSRASEYFLQTLKKEISSFNK